jgi:predicted esterase YcpF (UPF0227 family)
VVLPATRTVAPGGDARRFRRGRALAARDDRFEFRAEDVEALRELEPADLTARERYFAVIAKGDEVLDWREMTARVAGCRVKLLDGGDHALSDFDDHLPDVLAFLGLEQTGSKG